MTISYMHKGLDYDQVTNLTIRERNIVIEQLNEITNQKKPDKLIDNGQVQKNNLGKINIPEGRVG